MNHIDNEGIMSDHRLRPSPPRPGDYQYMVLYDGWNTTNPSNRASIRVDSYEELGRLWETLTLCGFHATLVLQRKDT